MSYKDVDGDGLENDEPDNSVGIIRYTQQINDPHKKGYIKSINYNDIKTKNDLPLPFFEYIKNPEYVHLYFDFDSIETKEEYTQLIMWLDSLKDVFGKYSIGGYTNDKETFGFLYKYIPNTEKTLSLHVIYYETKIKASVLRELMTHTKEGGFTYKINKNVDPNVYNITSRRLMRHVYSDKYYCKYHHKNKETAGSYNPPNTSILSTFIQIRGCEKEVDYGKLKDLFGYDYNASDESDLELSDDSSDDDEEVKKPNRKPKTHSKKNIKDVEFSDSLIIFTENEMIEFLDNFDNCFNTIMCILPPLYHSPYPEEFLIKCVQTWYNKVLHTHPGKATELIKKYYRYEETNKWFFSLTKHFKEETKTKYLNKYSTSINFVININNSDITYETIKSKTYEFEQIVNLFNDLRGCIGVIDDTWYLKILKEGQKFIINMSEEKLMKKIRTTKPFKANNNITLYNIVSKFSNYFRYDSADICKKNKKRIINLFQGFKYPVIKTNDFTIIQPFLNHIKNIICNGDVEKYDYLLKWYANIFQNITVKNGTMPIIYGAQGSGKSFAVEVFGELLGNYAIINVDDLDKVFGKFNGLIGQRLYININEPPDANDKFSFTGKIKSKLTQKKHIQETKGIDQIEINSWCNYTITTNNPSPVQEEKGNRRFIYFATNNSKCGDEEYFNKLCQPIQQTKQGDYNKQFMGVLLHYMLTQIDVSDFNPERLIRDINSRVDVDYNEQLERQYNDLDKLQKLVVDEYKMFVDGISTKDINRLNLIGYTDRGIIKKLNQLCDVKRITIKGVKTTTYKLKGEDQNPDLWNIIKYKHYGEEETNETEDNQPIKINNDEEEL